MHGDFQVSVNTLMSSSLSERNNKKMKIKREMRKIVELLHFFAKIYIFSRDQNYFQLSKILHLRWECVKKKLDMKYDFNLI